MKTVLQTLHIARWKTKTKEGINAFEIKGRDIFGQAVYIGKMYNKKLIAVAKKTKTLCPITHPIFNKVTEKYI